MPNQLTFLLRDYVSAVCNIISLSANDVCTTTCVKAVFMYSARVTVRCQSNASLGWQSETLLTLRGR